MTEKEIPTHCANPKCGKPLVHIEGRRKKKYCDQVCNSKHWQATHYIPSNRKLKFKTIPIEQWNEIEKKLAIVPVIKVQDANEPTNVVEPVKPLGSKQTNTTIKTSGSKILTPYEEMLKKKRGF